MASPTATTPLPTGTWAVDPARSRVEFEAKQLGVAAVRGAFKEFRGTLELGDDLAGARVHGSVSAASVDTDNRRRDGHLQSRHFLDVEQFPRLTFASSEIRRLHGDALEMEGELTLHGVTRPITLTAEVRGTEEGLEGDRRVVLEVGGELSRGDYGMTWGRGLVSDKVKLQLDISAVRQP